MRLTVQGEKGSHTLALVNVHKRTETILTGVLSILEISKKDLVMYEEVGLMEYTLNEKHELDTLTLDITSRFSINYKEMFRRLELLTQEVLSLNKLTKRGYVVLPKLGNQEIGDYSQKEVVNWATREDKGYTKYLTHWGVLEKAVLEAQAGTKVDVKLFINTKDITLNFMYGGTALTMLINPNIS